ncbi:uncharacterized protein LOC110861036 isoform X2 [Folsomia candida]|uniref:uncharacterized protein LOC110861036 isoform X2 n=1 Tax=Folsomia candida TaxID=158441 RepID=UPI000B8EEA0E|nr:uncharacterized protein LOC110861036 isoform X2 [Folsomia candida]
MEGLLARVDYLENIVTKLAKWTHFSEIVNFEFPAPAVISLEDENEKINPKSSRPRRRGRRRSLRSALSPEEEVTNPDIISDDTIIKTEDADTYEEMLPDDDPDFVIFPQDLDTGSDDDSFQADPDSLPSSSSKNLGLEESNNSGSDPIVTLTSCKNRPMISKGGYLFNFERNGAKKKIWRCKHHRHHKCPVRVHTTNSVTNPEILTQIATHNHAPDPKLCEVQLALHKIRDTAKNSTLPPTQIVATHSSTFSQAGKDIAPLKNNITRTIRNIRCRKKKLTRNSALEGIAKSNV